MDKNEINVIRTNIELALDRKEVEENGTALYEWDIEDYREVLCQAKALIDHLMSE